MLVKNSMCEPLRAYISNVIYNFMRLYLGGTTMLEVVMVASKSLFFENTQKKGLCRFPSIIFSMSFTNTKKHRFKITLCMSSSDSTKQQQQKLQMAYNTIPIHSQPH